MKLGLITIAALVSCAQGSRYGLLRVGSASDPTTDAVSTTSTPSGARRSLFDEDVSLAFRQLFGYQPGLSLSMANGAQQLSLSMMGQAAQLSMGNLAKLSLSMMTEEMFASSTYAVGGAGLSPALTGGTRGAAGAVSGQPAVTAEGATSDGADSTSSASSSHLGAGSVAAIAAVGGVAAVAVVATLLAKKRKDAASVASSTGSVSDGSL